MTPGEKIILAAVFLVCARLFSEPPGRRRIAAEAWAVLIFLILSIAFLYLGVRDL